MTPDQLHALTHPLTTAGDLISAFRRVVPVDRHTFALVILAVDR